MYFTEEQKERANAVLIADILSREHEEVERSGNECRWKRHRSVTFRGNRWYRHSEQVGSHAIDFMQEFFGMNFPEAVTYLLNGETEQVIQGKKHITPEQGKVTGQRNVAEQKKVKEQRKQPEPNLEAPKQLVIPEKNDTMKRVYAYLMQKRYIDRDILSFFAKRGTLYESKEHHNAVFVGVDKNGEPKHIHKKGTYSEGGSFRINEEGSDPCYGFGYAGTGNRLYVFEAPIDFLSFLTLYPKDWQKHSYIVLNGVAEHAMLQMLCDYPQIDTVSFCLDYDPAGIENSYRLAEIVKEQYPKIKLERLMSVNKDWNEDLKAKNGEEPIPGREHPKIVECRAWCEQLKQVAENIDMKYATEEYLKRYHYGMYQALKQGTDVKYLEEAFDGDGMLLSGIAVRIMEKYGREMAYEATAGQIIDNLGNRYRPHKDKGNLKTRITSLQKAFEEVMECYPKNENVSREDKGILVKKCMSLTMECIRAHIFVAEKVQSQRMEGGMEIKCSQ